MGGRLVIGVLCHLRPQLDSALQQQLIDAQAAAGKAFGVATVALEAALDRARAHDEKGGA